MGSVIHGDSYKALKHLRTEPASLAVYWVYCARQNHEGVAWPSLRGLAKEIAWDKTVVGKGRALLVELGALEIVPDYVRPEWRNLSPAEKARKMNLDQSEYYRPTGILRADGDEIPMLYAGGSTPAKIDGETASHVRPRRPSGEAKAKPRDYIFEYVAKYSFGITSAEMLAATNENGRIGQIASWLKGKEPTKTMKGRGCVQLDPPASVKETEDYFKWYKKVNPTLPNLKDVGKFVESFLEFRSTKKSRPAASRQYQPTQVKRLSIAQIEAIKAEAQRESVNGH